MEDDLKIVHDAMETIKRYVDIRGKSAFSSNVEKENALKELFDKSSTYISGVQDKELVLHSDDNPGFGSMTFYGKNIVVTNPQKFNSLFNLSDTFEIFTERGKSVIELSFYGMASVKKEGV